MKIKYNYWPIEIKGDEIMVDRSEYLDQVFLEFSKKFAKESVELKKSDVENYMLIFETGRQVDESQTPEMALEIWHRIKRDGGKSMEFELKKKELKKDRIHEVKREVESSKNNELALVSKATEMDFGTGLGEFYQAFDMGVNVNKCIPKGDVSVEQLLSALGLGFVLQQSCQWIVGDIVNELNRRGYEDVVMEVCKRYDKSYSTIYSWSRTCRMFPPSVRDRHVNVPFSTAMAIACSKYADDDATNKKLAQETFKVASEQKWSQSEARKNIRKIQGKQDKPLEIEFREEIDKKNTRYLNVMANNIAMSWFSSIPHDYSHEIITIDIEKQRYLDKVAGEEVWLPFKSEE